MATDTGNKFKYLLESEQDIRWGLTVTTAGFESVAAGQNYPLKEHPSRYLFSAKTGRVLQEYQMVYVIKGEGRFESQSHKPTTVSVGDIFMLFPNEWHNYSCNKKTGWEVYWIGFRGVNMDNRYFYGFFRPQNPIFHVGINERMIQHFREVIKMTEEQPFGFQQILAGCVNYLLGVIYASEQQSSPDSYIIKNIHAAQLIMQEQFTSNITLETIARNVGMGYVSFRKAFKKHIGFAPHQYLMELKLLKMKELLVATPLSIKEIADKVGFEDVDHCCHFFKKHTGMTMQAYCDSVKGPRREDKV